MGMTFDARATTRRMPAAVLTAAILLGFFGGVAGLVLTVLGALQMGDAPTAMPFTFLGVLFLVLAVTSVIGLAKGNRGAQLVAMGLGAIWFLVGLLTISDNPVGSVLGVIVGAAVALLVVVPVSSREWFAR